ncbi:hypothetical protein K1719_011472 [Acacia pycnantha]|nr:hypothetical protein K1719_011472 [Acacia pycnantha]
MGSYSGFIAMHATLASRDVDCCLIPESNIYLEGEGGFFEFIEKRLKENGHMICEVLDFGSVASANKRSQNKQPEIAGTPEHGLNQENRASVVAEEKEKSENLDIETEESNSLKKVRQWISSITTHSETKFKSQMGFSSECFVES